MNSNANALSSINMAKELLEGIHNAITDPSLKLTKDQMARLLGKLSNLSGVMVDVGTKVGILEGKLMTYEKIAQQSPQITPLCDMLAEMEERKVRSKNVILLNVPECNSNSTAECITEDKKQVMSTLSLMNAEINFDEMKIYRIGRKILDNVRPIKIELKDTMQAKQFIFNKTRLPNGIRLKPDRTLQQRQQLTDLWNKMEERKKKGETDILIKHINGIPKIVKAHSKNFPQN